MEIHRGKYRLESRKLHFDLDSDLNFDNDGQCFYIRGGNGFGKTSFLEKIIIPALEAENLRYLYIGQDIRTQLYTLRALLSIEGLKVFGKDEVELLKMWICRGRSASVLILDEFDKYFPDYGFVFDWSKAFIGTYIIVTHLDTTRHETVADGCQISNVRFELTNIDGQLKNIRVSSE